MSVSSKDKRMKPYDNSQVLIKKNVWDAYIFHIWHRYAGIVIYSPWNIILIEISTAVQQRAWM